MQKWIIGIDEVGRGPLAGPVTVGVVCVPENFNWQRIPGVTDSKLLRAERRMEIYTTAQQLKRAEALRFTTASVRPQVIDRIGITNAVSRAIRRGLERLAVNPQEVQVKLDGLLRAPDEYVYQETIVKGDQKEKAIGLASVIAKVQRDAYMQRCAKRSQYAPYGFAEHKGYGTAAHRRAIKTYSLSDMHRVTYCRAFDQKST